MTNGWRENIAGMMSNKENFQNQQRLHLHVCGDVRPKVQYLGI